MIKGADGGMYIAEDTSGKNAYQAADYETKYKQLAALVKGLHSMMYGVAAKDDTEYSQNLS